MSLGLSAPAAVPVELRAGDRRVYRLSAELGTGGLRLERAAPFEPGRPISVRFTIPGTSLPLEVPGQMVATGDASEEGGERGATAVYFLDPTPDVRAALGAYISDRLGIPPMPSFAS